MSLPVHWSPYAKDDLADTLEYVEESFGTDAALKLVEAIDKTVNLIAEFPQMYPRSNNRPTLRKAVITKQTSLIYRIKRSEIQILHVWDNRRSNEF